MSDTRSCLDCKHADWHETPSAMGECTYTVPDVPLPSAFITDMICRHRPHKFCPTYERKETDANG